MTTTKNVIYILTFTELWDDVARNLLREHGWKPVLFVGPDPSTLSVENSIFSGIPHYETGDARRAETPKHIPEFKKRALDATLLDSYAHEQSIVFELMTRFIPNDKKAGYDERRRYYWELIRIWEGIFDTVRPDIVAAASFPHRIFDYIAYLTCERKGIPYLSIERTTFPHISYASTTITDMSAPFREEMRRLSNKNFPDLKLENDTIEYIDKLRKSYEVGKPVQLSSSGYFSSTINKQKHSAFQKTLNHLPQEFQNILNIIKITLKRQIGARIDTLVQPSDPTFSKSQLIKVVKPLDVEIAHIKKIQSMRRTICWYKKRIEEVDKSVPFIYFSANFQPERSTIPDAGYFHNYHLILDILERATPSHWNIYYKEHPHSFHRPIKRDNPRSIKFYMKMQAVCPRIKFLSPTSDPFSLIDHAKAVALARGTAAWESISRGKPVLSFGNAWYECCPGVYKIRNVEDCDNAYKEIEGGYIGNDSELQLFIKSVENVGVDFRYYNRDLVRVRAEQSGHRNTAADFVRLEGNEYNYFVAAMSAELIWGIERYQKR